MSKKPVPRSTVPSSPSDDGLRSAPDRHSTTIEAEVERQIGGLVSSGQREQIVSRVTRILLQESFSGPLAHPRHLREYEDIVPGSAERIIRMAEKALEHRAAMDTKIVDAQIADQVRGMRFGLAALGAILLFAALFGYWEMEIVAGLFLGTAVLGSIPVFVMGRNGSQSESNGKTDK